MINLLSVLLDNSNYLSTTQFIFCEMPEKSADLQPKHFQVVSKAARVFQSNFPQLNTEIDK